MKKSITWFSGLLLACGFSLVVASCNDNAGEATDTNTDSTALDNANNPAGAMANISGTFPDTTVNGMAEFMQQNGKVKMMLNLTIPSKANQSVAVHLHEHGDCGDTAHHAGGHWNPTNTMHGKWGSDAFHAGDIGNISLDGEGRGSVEIETDLWSIGGDATKDILNKSVVVHGGTDDYTSQPSGNSGTRIGCGPIMRKS